MALDTYTRNSDKTAIKVVGHIGILVCLYLLWKRGGCDTHVITASQTPGFSPPALNKEGRFTIGSCGDMAFTIDMGWKDYLLTAIEIDGFNYLWTLPSNLYEWGSWEVGEGVFTVRFTRVNADHTLVVRYMEPVLA